MKLPVIRTLGLSAAFTLIPLVMGCGTANEAGNGTTAAQGGNAPATVAKGEKKEKDDHSGWWCPEHGVPEKICAQCDAKLAAEYKKKGDWCAKHNRPDSQCFICHPDLEAKFAAQYEAKYGTKPPKREEEEHSKGEAGHDDKDHDHKDEKKS